MTGEFSHEQLDVYQAFLDFVRLSAHIISDITDRVAALEHLDRATESIGSNLIRGNSQKAGSDVRISYLDVSIASTHECAGCLDVCRAKDMLKNEVHFKGTNMLWRIRGMLLGLKRARGDRVGEPQKQYESASFPHARLNVYGAALDAVRWSHPLVRDSDQNARERWKLDKSTTGTVLNIAEALGRATTPDRCRFVKTAYEHALQTVLLLDMMVARKQVQPERIERGKAIQHRVVSMLFSLREKMAEEEPD